MVNQVNNYIARDELPDVDMIEQEPGSKKRRTELVASEIFCKAPPSAKRRLHSQGMKRSRDSDKDTQNVAERTNVKRKKTKDWVNQKLKDFIRRGSIDDCASALRSGANPDTQTDKGNTTLHLAVLKGDARFARLCLKKGASTHVKNKEGNTPLFLPEENRLPDEVVIQMISRHPYINALNASGESPLHSAIKNGYSTAVILACLEKGADVNLLSREGNSSLGLLNIRVHNDLWNSKNTRTKVKLVDANLVYRFMKQRGAAFDHKNIYQFNFLHIACIWGLDDLAFSALEFGEKFETLSEDEESSLVYLFKYQEKNTVKTSLKEKLLDYVITQKLPLKYQNAEQYPRIQTFMKYFHDPFLAKALFALTENGKSGDDIFSEDEKQALLLEVFANRDTKQFLKVIIQFPNLARKVFPLLIKGGFTLVSSFDSEEVKLLVKFFKRRYKMPPALVETYREVLQDIQDMVFMSTSLWLLPFVDKKNFIQSEKDTQKNYGDAFIPKRSRLAKALLLQDLPPWASNARVVCNLMPQLVIGFFADVTLGLVKSPEKLKIYSNAIREFNLPKQEQKWINNLLTDLYCDVLGVLPSSLFSEKMLTGTLIELLPIVIAYRNLNDAGHPFDVIALLYLSKETSKEFLEANKDSSTYYNILEYALNNPNILSQFPAEIIQLLVNGLDKEQEKELIAGSDFFSRLSLPEAITQRNVLNNPKALALLKLIPTLFSGIDSDKMQQHLNDNYWVLKNAGEKWMEDPEGYLLFVLVQLMLPPDSKEKLGLNREMKYKILDALSDEHYLVFFSQLFHHPQWAEGFNRSLCKLLNLETKDRGRAKNTWEEFAQQILLRLNKISHHKPSTFKQNYSKRLTQAKRQKPEIRSSDCFQKLQAQGWMPLRWQGRTLIFKRESDGRFLAVKWQKDGEDVSELRRELETVKILQEYKEELQLKSQFPEPVGVFEFSGELPPNYYSSPTVKVEARKDGARRVAYVYEFPDESYFIYPNDSRLTEDQFQKIREVSYHDLGKLAAEDIIMVALADLFHNNEPGHETREDAGRFIPLIGLIRSYFFGEGAGRLSRFWKAIEFPNLGLSGIRDVGDSDTLDHLSKKTHPVTAKNFSDLFEERRISTKQPKAKTVLRANFLAEYLQVDELIVGARAKHDNHLNWRSTAKVAKTAELLKDGPTALFSSYTGIDREVVKPFIDHNGVFWDRYGKQMGLWMQNNRAGYLPHVKKKVLPKGVYAEDVEMVFSEKLRGMSPEIGFAIDGENPDLGTVNGPYPVTEGVKDRYMTIAYMLLMREVMALAKLLKEERDRGHSFQEGQPLYERILHLNPFSNK